MHRALRHIGCVRTAVLLSLTSLLSISCEEVIDLDLDQVPQRIVIEGIVSDKPSTSRITISFSESIYKRSASGNVAGAKVILSDNTGRSEQLQEIQAGVFGPSSVGIAGREYRLTVTHGGMEYTATSHMPVAMALDSVRWTGSRFNQFFSNSGSLIYYVSNKPGIEEYCLIKAYNLNESSSKWTLYSDKYSDGKQVALESPSMNSSGVAMRIELLSIDRATYDYFVKLREVIGSDGFEIPDILRLSDFNPKSNLSNNALGYFSAQSQRDYLVNLR